MKRFFILPFAIILIITGAEGAQTLINAQAPGFSLHDQYDLLYDLQQDRGKVLVLLASDGEGAKHNRQWVDAIKERYQDRIPIIGIADTRKVPFFMKGTVKDRFKKSPAHILLDWDGIVFTSYGLAPNISNIVLIDKQGIVRWLHAGEATQEACGALFREIDKLER